MNLVPPSSENEVSNGKNPHCDGMTVVYYALYLPTYTVEKFLKIIPVC